MNKVKLITDSTADLSPELIKQYDVAVIPLYVNFGTRSYKDNVDIDTRTLYRMVDEGHVLPTTSAPTPDDFIAEFGKYINQGMDILCTTISSKFSSSYQNACLAAAAFPAGRIKVIDACNLSSGIALQVLTAADCLNTGLSLEKTFALVKGKVDKVETEFIIDSVEYLHKGGRCSGLQMFLSSLLKIHPIIKVENGAMKAAAKVRGGRQQVLNQLLSDAVKNLARMDPRRVFITHSLADEDAAWLKEQLSKLEGLQDIIITNASCVISTHCGPKTVGILYLLK
jgi:DegV family protein with EDD domain